MAMGDSAQCLEERLLNACLTFAIQRMWKFEHFPFERVMAKWWAAKQRHAAPMNNHQQQKQQQPITIFDTDEND
eukprot:1149337-Pelagomonas_calceolata.AAC.6